jgi:3-deoxy-D-manno-octulosonic-acid transferase
MPTRFFAQRPSVARSFYTLIYSLLLPVFVARLWWRGRVNPGYRHRISERFGYIPHHPQKGGLWIHAVSVGETLAAAPFVKRYMAEHPGTPIIITSTTPTGSEQVKRLFGERVFHMYLPYDLPIFIHRFIKAIRPGALMIMETELWPNLLAGCEQHQVPVVLANARLSENSARGYGKFSALTRPMLHRLSLVAAQNHDDGQRFLKLGLPTDRLHVIGSVKFDITIPADCAPKGAQLRAEWGADRPVLALASSHPEEDEQVLDIYRALEKEVPGLLLLLIPRHPERFEAVTNAARSRQLSVHRRSNGRVNTQIQVYVADTMGEMLPLLASADLVIMGGSLIEHGGHNPIEPAALGKATLIGPYYANFAAIVDTLKDDGALEVMTDLSQMKDVVVRHLHDKERRVDMGRKAQAAVDENRGAVAQLVQLTSELMSVR